MTQKKLLVDVDLPKIVRRSLESMGVLRQSLSESYVAQPKSFEQVSELVSAKTKATHRELYAKYVEQLNRASAELDTADRASASPSKSAFRDLKHAETHCANAVWLHELYFGNTCDPHSEIYMNSLPYMRLERDWGTFDDWQKDFVACALSACEGWAIMGYSMHLQRYVNVVIDSHDQHVPIGLYPVIVLDMWSHAYFRDYLSDRESFIVSQMRELNWRVIGERFERAEKIAEAFK